eukprot:5338992-Alexandrium_andersonii.AAC.1
MHEAAAGPVAPTCESTRADAAQPVFKNRPAAAGDGRWRDGGRRRTSLACERGGAVSYTHLRAHETSAHL